MGRTKLLRNAATEAVLAGTGTVDFPIRDLPSRSESTTTASRVTDRRPEHSIADTTTTIRPLRTGTATICMSSPDTTITITAAMSTTCGGKAEVRLPEWRYSTLYEFRRQVRNIFMMLRPCACPAVKNASRIRIRHRQNTRRNRTSDPRSTDRDRPAIATGGALRNSVTTLL